MHPPVGVVSALSDIGQEIRGEKKVLLATGLVLLRLVRVDARRSERIACALAVHPGQEEAAALVQLDRAGQSRPVHQTSQ